MPGSDDRLSVFSARDDRPTAPKELYDQPRWYACRTRARAEKQVHRLLVGTRIEHYLPLIEEEHQWADRRKQVAVPLFPGYTFVRFALSQIHDVLKTPGIVTIVKTDGIPAPLQETELDSIRVLVEAANETGVIPSAVEFLEPGEEVLVISGPFEGMIGVLLGTRGSSRVAVRLSAIGQAVSVELNSTVLRPLHL